MPLHARDVVAAERFSEFARRPQRLRLFLDAYGYDGPVRALLDAVRLRVADHARGVRERAADGD